MLDKYHISTTTDLLLTIKRAHNRQDASLSLESGVAGSRRVTIIEESVFGTLHFITILLILL